jgi:hypothetical protein
MSCCLKGSRSDEYRNVSQSANLSCIHSSKSHVSEILRQVILRPALVHLVGFSMSLKMHLMGTLLAVFAPVVVQGVNDLIRFSVSISIYLHIRITRDDLPINLITPQHQLHKASRAHPTTYISRDAFHYISSYKFPSDVHPMHRPFAPCIC